MKCFVQQHRYHRHQKRQEGRGETEVSVEHIYLVDTTDVPHRQLRLSELWRVQLF